MPALKQVLAPGAPRPAGGCSVCGVVFLDGEEVAVCAVDGALHHPECWQWNGDRCGTPGCAGRGALVDARPTPAVVAGAVGVPPGHALPASPRAPSVYAPPAAPPVTPPGAIPPLIAPPQPAPGYTTPRAAPPYSPAAVPAAPVPRYMAPPPGPAPAPPISRRRGRLVPISGLVLLVLVLGMAAVLFVARPSNPQEPICFANGKPCVTGAFLAVWRQYGGSTPGQPGVFGQPLEDAHRDDNGLLVQPFTYFQMEEAPDSPDPTHVNFTQLGTLLIQWGGPSPAPAPPNPNCLYFPETRHNLCGPFRAYWEGIGRTLAIPVLTDTRSVAIKLLGYPISEELTWAADGQARPAQWFERARLEVVASGVQLAPLGREVSILAQNTTPLAMFASATAAPSRTPVPPSPTRPPTDTPIPIPAAGTWRVRLYNMDDYGEARLNGAAVVTAAYHEDTGWVDISAQMQPGDNRLYFRDWNGGGGYAWGFAVQYQQRIVWSSEDGVVGVTSARNNDQSRPQQVVFEGSLILHPDGTVTPASNGLDTSRGGDTPAGAVLGLGQTWRAAGFDYKLARIALSPSDLLTYFYVTNLTDQPAGFASGLAFFALQDDTGRLWPAQEVSITHVDLISRATSGDLGPFFAGAGLNDPAVQLLTLTVQGLNGWSGGRWRFAVPR